MQFDNLHIRWLGHDGFFIRCPKCTVCIDPYKPNPAWVARLQEEDKADLVLITHEHFDHCAPETVTRLRKRNALVAAPAPAAKKLGDASHSVRQVEPFETLGHAGVTVRVVPAYNTQPERVGFHPKTAGHVGYVLTMAEQTLYHLGDTDMIPAMDDVGWIDIAFVPVSGTYVMDASEAAEWVRKYQPRIAIPMHYGSIVGSDLDAEEFKRLVGDMARVEILARTR